MRASILAFSILLLVASAATAGTDLQKAEKQLQKRAVLASSAPALKKSLCICNSDLLTGTVGRLEYVKQEVGAVLMTAQCHILAFEIPSGIALGGGAICPSFTILP